MYRPGINRSLGFIFLIPLFLLTHCSQAQILGIPQNEAAELLRAGNLSFIKEAVLPNEFSRAVTELEQLSHIHPATAYYSGVLISNASPAEARNRELELLLFTAALSSPSLAASREAALRLIPLVLNTTELLTARNVLSVLDSRNLVRRQDNHLAALRAACMFRLGNYNEAARVFPVDHAMANTETASEAERWGKAIALFAAWHVSPSERLAREISDFLFTILPGEILRWASREAGSQEGLFAPEELMVLAGRLLSGNFGAMLLNMTPALQMGSPAGNLGGGANPQSRFVGLENGENIFFRYPSLIAYLGRAFQFHVVNTKIEKGLVYPALWVDSAIFNDNQEE